jgi:hypothetical protein
MSNTYTQKIFNVFQDELQRSSSYYVVEVQPHTKFDIVPYKVDLGRTFRYAAFLYELNSELVLLGLVANCDCSLEANCGCSLIANCFTWTGSKL